MDIKTENNSNHASTTTLIFTHKTLKRSFSNHVLIQDLIKTEDVVFNGIYRNEQGSLQRRCRVWVGGVLWVVGHKSYAIEIAFSCYLCLQFCILYLYHFDFKGPKQTMSFLGYVYIKKQRDRVSAGFVRVVRVSSRPAELTGFQVDQVSGRPAESTGFQVNRVSSGQLLNGFLLRPGPVPSPGRPGPGSTHRAGPSFKTVI